MKHLQEMGQYQFERDVFIREVRRWIPDIEDIFDFHHNNYDLTTDNFKMFRIEDEYFILHIWSGTMINWYKKLGRANTCNKNINMSEFRHFIRMFARDVKTLSEEVSRFWGGDS